MRSSNQKTEAVEVLSFVKFGSEGWAYWAPRIADPGKRSDEDSQVSVLLQLQSVYPIPTLARETNVLMTRTLSGRTRVESRRTLENHSIVTAHTKPYRSIPSTLYVESSVSETSGSSCGSITTSGVVPMTSGHFELSC